jgi:hypothetical protein
MNVVKNSAMRFSLVVISLAVCIVLLTVSFYIVMKTLNGEEPDWSTLGVFAGGIAAIMTGVGWNKTRQKEIESYEYEDE